MILFDEVVAYVFFFFASEQYSVRKDYCHNAVRLYVVEVVEQECVVGFSFWSYAVVCVSWLGFLVFVIPLLGVWRVAYDRIHVEWL